MMETQKDDFWWWFQDNFFYEHKLLKKDSMIAHYFAIKIRVLKGWKIKFERNLHHSSDTNRRRLFANPSSFMEDLPSDGLSFER